LNKTQHWFSLHQDKDWRSLREVTAMKNIIQNVVIFSLTLCSCACVRGSDWPQWRGPHRDGISQETGLLNEWPQEGPKLRWQLKDIGSGFSTPAVVGARLYLLSNKGLEEEFVLALSDKDGSKVWSRTIGKVGEPNQNPSYPAARSTPTVDGEVLYALGSDGDLAALKTSDGGVMWKKNLRSDFGGAPGRWAYSESPLIDGDVLVCTPGGKEATLVALNKKTGETIWKCATPAGDQAAYSSVIIVNSDGIKQYVQFVQNGLIGIDAKNGKLLWRYEKTAKGSPANIPTPVANDSMIYSGASMTGGGLVKLKHSGDSFEAEQVYYSRKLPTAIGGAIKIGKYLYGASGQVLLCVDFASGEVKWEDRSIAPASLCYADGRFYLHAENGSVALVEPSPEGYREHGRFNPPDQPDRGSAKAWAYPVVANGRLYIRDASCLWAYDVKGG
jgi:outer membrane protein assembly factor BamB